MSLKILILGVNGFIGSSLSEYILKNKDWTIYGMDIACHKISGLLEHPSFHFKQADMTTHSQWVYDHIQQCDVILPLVAIANPRIYVQKPLKVFELDFEANLPIVRQCVSLKKRLIFPSTSEVYGMSLDGQCHEENSPLVVGPIHKQRWIYSCAKQMMDRLIYAYGIESGLDYTLFRPFNWIGPKLDAIQDPDEGGTRALSSFLSGILYKKEIILVNGGEQRRSFTDIDDGIDALVRIIENKDGCASGRIFNIGNPDNNYSMAEMASFLLEELAQMPECENLARSVTVKAVASDVFFGEHYQDMQNRVPSIDNARRYLRWAPQVSLRDSLRKTLMAHLQTIHSFLSKKG